MRRLTFRYPNGKRYTKQAIPQKMGKANRGMSLEEDINQSIIHYRNTERAIIHKKPTPVQIVNVDYPKRSRAKITEAYFRQASTTDYNGVYKGRYVDFEAKETHQVQSFPLKNLHEHQITHMQEIDAHGGFGFLILRFARSQETFVIKTSDFLHLKASTERKSVQKTHIETYGVKLANTTLPPVDFLPAVDLLFQ
ncbi:Holliday junction resolvase RecU [Geomicrobium sp. JCM 19039]|uniref:Holliday junction resolvase RecU n=1 Tax=Geomicrobium sp. JCM 19039 TaxID=1460636 RepID=UPI0035A6D150